MNKFKKETPEKMGIQEAHTEANKLQEVKSTVYDIVLSSSRNVNDILFELRGIDDIVLSSSRNVNDILFELRGIDDMGVDYVLDSIMNQLPAYHHAHIFYLLMAEIFNGVGNVERTEVALFKSIQYFGAPGHLSNILYHLFKVIDLYSLIGSQDYTRGILAGIIEQINSIHHVDVLVCVMRFCIQIGDIELANKVLSSIYKVSGINIAKERHVDKMLGYLNQAIEMRNSMSSLQQAIFKTDESVGEIQGRVSGMLNPSYLY